MRRRRRVAVFLIFLGCLLTTGLTGSARESQTPAAKLPTVDEILDRSIRATGGREAWLKLTSMHMKSDLSMSNPDVTGTVDMYMEAPNKQSECVKLKMGIFFCRTYDGKEGWSDSSTEGIRELQGKDLEDIRRESNFYTVLERKKDYKEMKVTGESDFDGLKVYVIQAVRTDGQHQELYFAKDTGLDAGVKDVSDDEAGVKTSYYEDYKQIAGPGVKIPTKIRLVSTKLNMRMAVEEIEPNAKIPASVFTKPSKSARDSSGSGVEGVPDNGKVTEDVYQNEFFSFQYTLPHGWTVHGAETQKALNDAGRELVAGDDTAKKSALTAAQKRSFDLLTVFEFPLGTPGKENRGIQVVAEGVAFAPGIKTGSDYILTMKETLKNTQMAIKYVGDPVEEHYGSATFFRQNMENTIGSVVVFESIYTTIMKGYAVSFIFTGRSREKVDETGQSMNSFKPAGGAPAKP